MAWNGGSSEVLQTCQADCVGSTSLGGSGQRVGGGQRGARWAASTRGWHLRERTAWDAGGPGRGQMGRRGGGGESAASVQQQGIWADMCHADKRAMSSGRVCCSGNHPSLELSPQPYRVQLPTARPALLPCVFACSLIASCNVAA